MQTDNAIQVLLVEDNPADACLVKEALREAPAKLTVVGDGAEAIAFLNREGTHSAAPRPDLILLDLQLPRKTGFEVLNEIKSSPELRQIPVVILSGSASDENICRCYELNANCFVSKKSDWPAFLQTVRGIQSFWLSIAHLPPKAE